MTARRISTRTLPVAALATGLAALAACQRPDGSADTADRLPFFNTPDWTARWIGPAEPAADTIHRIPAFQLTDQLGRTVTERDLDGRITIANFFFTRCRNICPKMSSHLRLLQNVFAGDTTVILLSHSVDPAADSVPALRAYASALGADPSAWRLLTGDRARIYELARRHYFAGDAIGPDTAGRDFLHTEDFILLDVRRRIRGLYNGTLRSEVDRIREDVAILKRE
jgi:protein SCO1/2